MSISTSTLIGFCDQVYKDLPTEGTQLEVNHVEYTVYKTLNDASNSYQGMILIDNTTRSLIVVNRGTQELEDWKIDAQMADKDVNAQWSDALSLAQDAADYASANDYSTVYAVGHSLGGTLAQMQAAYFGWKGVTFNAYGADAVYNQLLQTGQVPPISPNADITNYRTMYDLVSDASVQIGPVKTLETPDDQKLFASGILNNKADFISKFYTDHLIDNFYESGTDIGGTDPQDQGDHIYKAVPAFDFSPSPRTVTIAQDQVAAVAATLEVATAYKSMTDWLFVPFFPQNFQDVQNAATNVWELLTGQTLTGMSMDIPANPTLLQNALNPDPANNIYRAALVAGSPVVLQGADPAQVASYSLWAPGQSTGLTKDYLVARNDMVQTRVKLAGEGYYAGGTVTTDSQNSYIYMDFSETSPYTVYKVVGTGPDTYTIEFGTDGIDVLNANGAPLSELFGGAGNDIFIDSSGRSTLEGGAGDDEYVIDGTQVGTDHILDTDGQGYISWGFADGSSATLTGGDAVPGGTMWKSADGSIIYTELAQADGTTELEIHVGNKTAFIDDFTNGELGITLNDGEATSPGAGNLGNFATTTYPDHTEYQDQSGTGGSDSMVGVSTTASNYNVIEGEGNAAYIYAGDGDNDAFADDSRTPPAGWVFVQPRNVEIQGGTGDQLLVGFGVGDGAGNGQETITGGAMGQDTAPWTTIDGGGANVNALLNGGSQNSLILAGLGADTILAGSAAPSSGQPDPITVALAGLSFWAAATQTELGGGSAVVTGEPEVSIADPGDDNPASFQMNMALSELVGDPGVVDGPLSPPVYGAPFGLLGSEWDTGTNVSPWTDPNGNPVLLPGSLMIGGSGEDYLIGNSGNDTIVGGTPSHPITGVIDEVLVGGGGADLIYGGAGAEWIYAGLSPAGNSAWADLDPSDADTIYGGTGDGDIYGSGGDDVIYGGDGNYTINTGNGNAYVEAGSGNTIVNGGSGNDTIVAGSGVDSITTGDGNTYVQVQGGQSTIITGAGADTIEGAGGEAFITEGSGATTILAGPGAGTAVVESGSGITTVQLQDGLTESTLIARDVNGDLELSDGDSDTQIWFAGYFAGGSGSVTLQFGDGTTWGTSQILAASMSPRTDGGDDTLEGSDGNDSITAGYGDTWIVGVSGNNTLTGGAGDDTIQGGSGADTIQGGSGTTEILGGIGSETYVYNLGDGSDTIIENRTTTGADVMQFGAGIDPSDVNYSYDSSSNSLLIQLGAVSSAAISIQGFAAQPSQHQISTFSFADGTTLTGLQVLQQAVAIYGTSADDTLNGTQGPDYFDGKGGDDSVNGNGGSDTFVFNAGYGQLIINAPAHGQGASSVLELGAGITAPSLFAQVGAGGWDLLLTDGIQGDEIVLQGFDYADYEDQYNTVETVELADGTTFTKSQLIQMELADSATAGGDTLIGGPDADYIDGKGGSDYEEGFGGNDTFVFNSGYGKLEIFDQYPSGQQPVLKLGSGITEANLQVRTNGESLFLDDGASGDEVTLDYMWQNGIATPDAGTLDGVQAVQLSDGTTLTLAQLAQMEAATGGTTGDDTLIGTAGNDLLDAKGGNDSVDGEGGSDTFVYSPGYGQMEIREDYSAGQQPILELGAGIAASALHVTSDGYDLLISDEISDDQIKLDGMADSSRTSGIEEVQLADGSTLTRDQLLQMSHQIIGTPGSDTLIGTPGDDYFDGEGGSDLEKGEGGQDTFVFDEGYGQLTVYGSEGLSSSASIVMLGAGISASALHVTSNGMDLFLTDGISGDEITLEQTHTVAANGGKGQTSVQLADGTTLTAQQLISMEIAGGTSGNDSLFGTPNAEYFDGKGGNDVETGDGGEDTFIFNPGYGQLTVDGSGVVKLGAGITESTLHVTSNNHSLVLTDGTHGDSVTLSDAYSDLLEGKDSIAVQLADGTSLDAAQLASMAIADGSTGSDSLYGTTGSDLFDGKGGNDYESGEGGNDTFVFDPNYGKLTIDSPNIYGGSSVLELGSGIDLASLNVSENDVGDLIVSDGIPGDQIIIESPQSRGFPSSFSNVQTIQFADGSTLTQDQLVQMASNLNGTTSSDYLVGTRGADYIDGKGGNDYAVGNGGADTFVFDQGYGALEIGREYGYTVQLGPGITPADVKPWESHSGGMWDLILQVGVSNDVIRLDNMFQDEVSSNAVEFSDGTKLTVAQLDDEVNLVYNGDEVYRVGTDFVGQDVSDPSYASHIDIFYVDGLTSADVSVRGGDYLTLTNKSTGAQFMIEGYPEDSDNVSIHFSDGVVWGGAQILQAAQTGGPGSDTLAGWAGSEFFDGKGGDDSIVGDGGSDTFVFNAGYGDLAINESYASGDQPVLQLGTGITVSTLHASTDGTNLDLTDGVAGDEIQLVNMWYAGNGVASVQLADGTTLTASQLRQIAMTGTTGDDTLYGTSGADLIDGRGGSHDIETGEGGSDTFVFDSGYGNLEIVESYASGDNPVLQLGQGITGSTLHVTASGDDLVLADSVSGDQITLDGMETSATSGVSAVLLTDGTSFTRSQLLQMASPPNLAGSAGNDLLVGSSGSDVFDGSGGNDTAVGYGGNDTFVFNSGYGALEINESFASGQQPLLQLGPGITASALQVSVDDNNWVLTDGVAGDQITLDNQNATGSDGVALVQLADGTTLSAAQLFQMSSEITGTTGDDTLTGTSGADLIDGKGGNDSVIGDGGNDTFVFNSGYGDLEINEYANGAQPVLQLGAGIMASALHVSTDQTNLFLTDGVAGDEIQLDNMWYGSGGVASVQLTDGTTFTASQLRQMEMTGTTGNDTLYGTSGADLIDGRGGPYDEAIGQGASDTFVFDAGYGGLELIEDYIGATPVLQLGAGITASMLRVSVEGDDLELTDGISGDWITLYDQGLPDDLDGTYGVAVVQLADGTTLSAAQLVEMSHERIGTAANDTLTGTAGAELFDGEGGTDSVVGNGGNDTIDFNSGYGQLTVNESYTSGQQPELDLGAGITASALHVAASGNNLVLTDGVTGDKVTLISMWSSATHGVSFVHLADGTTLTRAQLIQTEIASGTTGNDTLTGTSGADLLDGKGGTDSLIGSGGNDTFVFDSGYGALTINEKFTSGQQPVLQLGAGITASTLRAAKSGNNLVLTDGVSGDKITLYDMWSSSTYGVAKAQLADGTSLTRSQLIQMEMTGTTGNDTLYGTSGANLIDGKGGTDSVVGSGGNDTFVFNPDYGKLTINESYVSGQTPVLQLGAGITESALRVTSNGTNLFLADGVTGDKITFVSMWSSATHGVSTVKLADGTSLTRSQLIQMEMTGTTGNDTIYGTSGADLVDGKGGTDSVVGSGGNDTFVFDSGYGTLTINESFTSGQTPVLELGSGITSASLSVSTSGTGGVNLVLADGITGDKITLIKMATSSTNGVTTVQLADGTTLTRSQLLGMEQSSAMQVAAASDVASIGTPGVVALADSSETSGKDTSIPSASRAPDLSSGNLASPSQVVIGAGNIRMPSATPDIIPSVGGVGKSLQQSHGASRAGTQAESPMADAQPPSPPKAGVGTQPSSATTPGAQQQSALRPISALDIRLGSSSSLTPAQPESDAAPRPGAPADPLMNDPDDLGDRSDRPFAIGGADGGAPKSGAVRGWPTALGAPFAQRQAIRTAGTVESMVKALAAQGGMGASRSLLDLGTDSPNQIRLQGGATWSLSTVDQTLAALSPGAGAAGDPSSQLTDLAHAQLVSAMASFSPTAQAESSPLWAPASEAYAIAVAAPMQ